MAIEDILQVKESVTERPYNPEGDPQTVNQTEFLRFQEQMGLGPDGVMAKLIQMFVEEPSEFTRKFGVEAADSVREFLGNQTQKELEGQGRVFAPNSAEIIGQNISFRPPEDSAIGTLQTDQANKAEMMLEFMKRQLQDEGQTWRPDETTERFRVLGHDQAQEMGLPVDEGQIWQMNEMTGKVEVLQGTTTSGRHRILDVDEAMKKGLPVDEGQIWELNQMTGQVNLLDTGDAQKPEWITEKEDFNPADYKEGYLMLMNNLYPDTDREIHEQEYDNWFRGGEGSEYYEDRKNRLLKLLSNMPGGGAGHESAEDFWKRAHPDQFDKEGNYIGKKEGENTLRVITDAEAEELGFKTGDGKIYQIDEETGDVTLKKPGLIEGGILKLMDWFKYGRTDPENR